MIKLKSVKTIKNRLNNAEQFDAEVNDAIKEGWVLTKRKLIQPLAQPNDNSTYFHTMLYAELEKYEEVERMIDRIKVKLDSKAFAPERAHADDAGLDLKSHGNITIAPNDSVTIDTGVHISIPKGYVGMLKSKSGLNVLHGITSEGVIDAGYTGSIVVKLYNNGLEPYSIEKGDKISQLVIMPIITPEIEIVDTLDDSERGSDGFGSSGR